MEGKKGKKISGEVSVYAPKWQSTASTILALVVLLAFFQPAQARRCNMKISGVMPDYAEIRKCEVSLDRRFVVYMADQQADRVFELFRVNLTGGPPIKLNGALAEGGRVLDFSISPDSQYLVYMADQRVNQVVELFSVPLAGGSALLISHNRKLYWESEVPNAPNFKLNAEGEYAVFCLG